MAIKGAAVKFAGRLPMLDGACTVLRFFGNPDSTGYEVYGESAEELCRALFRPVSSMDEVDGTAVLYVSNAALAGAVRECLFVQGWPVEVYGHAAGTWTLQRAATPGNTGAVEDLLEGGGSQDEPTVASAADPASMVMVVVAAVFIEERAGMNVVGLAAVAGSASTAITMMQFSDDPLLLNTESACVQLSVREIIYPEKSTLPAYARLRSIATGLGLVCTSAKAGGFCAEAGSRDIFKLSRCGAACQPMLDRDAALRSLSALASYMNLLSHDTALHSFAITEHQLQHHLRLDETALRSLDLFPKKSKTGDPVGHKQSHRRSDSLFGLLNNCRTAQGSRLLNQWIRQPLREVSQIEQRLDVVDTLLRDPLSSKAARDTLKGCSDLSRCGKRMWRGQARLQDLLVHHQVVLKGRELAGAVGGFRSPVISELFLGPLDKTLTDLGKFCDMIESSVDFDAVSRHEYFVRADFDADLRAIAALRSQCTATMDLEHQRVAIQCGLERFKKLKLDRSPIYGHHFRVSRLEAGSLVRDDKYIELGVLKSGVLFTTTKLKALSEEYREIEEQYLAKQSGLVRQMLASTMSCRDHFEVLNGLIALLDVFLSLAECASTAVKPWTRPAFSDAIRITKARHAMLEEVCRPFVENDLCMSDAPRFQFITGPNMGGKSTFMRQLALIAILAQMGSFVPAHSAVLPVFDAVMVRVGAGDNLARGVSTFQAEMLEMSVILRTATASSLVIIDELGRGTSTSEGFALAWAISKHLAETIRPFCLFATHFHELAEMAKQRPDLFGNLRMKADIGPEHQLQLEYLVEAGSCDRSFGIECAKLAGFPARVRRKAALSLAMMEGRLRFDCLEPWLRDAIGALGMAPESERLPLYTALVDRAPESMRPALLSILHA